MIKRQAHNQGIDRPQFSRNCGGYIALITAILISVSLLIMVAVVSFEGFFSRFTVLESQQKEESAYLAEACVNTAIIKIAQDDSYTGGEYLTVGDRGCEIVSVDPGTFPSERLIETQGTTSDAVTNLVVEIDTDDLPSIVIHEWTEVGSF